MKLVISGFKTKAQVEAFWDWYSGQGEQDSRIWFECRKDEGEIDVKAMYSSSNTFWNGDEYYVGVELYE